MLLLWELDIGFLSVSFLPVLASFTPNFIRHVADVSALGLILGLGFMVAVSKSLLS